MAGHLLLYRLLGGYRSDRLWVAAPSNRGDRRVAAVGWTNLRFGWERVQRTRFSKAHALLAILRCLVPVGALEKVVKVFRPELIVTILHAAAFIAATRLAKRHGLPMALIVHDDLMTFCECFQGGLRSWAQELVRQAYCQAAVRFCISAEMRDSYSRRFGVGAEVLHPLLAAGTIPLCGQARDSSLRRGAGLTFCYAGSVRSFGIKRQLALLGGVAAARGHRLIALAPEARALRADPLLRSAVIEIRDAVPAEQARDTLNAEADVLVAGLDANTGLNASIAFPTKLAEYTSLGRPILLCSPKGTAAANWAEGPPMRALCVEDPVREEDLERAVERLESDAGLREKLGAAALSEARERFSHEAVFDVFMRGISEALGGRK